MKTRSPHPERRAFLLRWHAPLPTLVAVVFASCALALAAVEPSPLMTVPGKAIVRANENTHREDWEQAKAGIAPPSAGEMVKHPGLRYAEAPDGTDANLLSLDLYAPDGAKDLPVMIYIHGGGWRRGDKSEVDAKPEYFTRRGFVFASLNYRLVPKVDILTQLQDSDNAIAWIVEHITGYGGDPARLHLIGHSAGGHHVALLATNGRFLENAGVSLDRLASVVDLDLLALNVPKIMVGEEVERRAETFGREPAVWREISPFHHVAPGKGVPPFFLVVTGRVADKAVDRTAAKLEQSRALQEALRAAGVRCELVDALEHDHNSLNRDIGLRGDAVTEAMERFHDSIIARP